MVENKHKPQKKKNEEKDLSNPSTSLEQSSTENYSFSHNHHTMTSPSMNSTKPHQARNVAATGSG